MATKSQEILLKGNTTNASAVPSSLKVREIAINALDRSLFTNDGNSIVKLYTGTTKWFDVNGNANNALKADSVAWSGISGKPTTFTPSAHTHTASDITGLPTSLKNPYKLTFGSKTYDGSAAATITASDLGALTAHQSIYALTLQVNGTSKGVYNPASAAKTINIAVPTKTSDITNDSGFITSAAIPTALKNPYAVEIKANGVSLGTYDGSAAATFNLSAANVGAANKVHTHTASDVSGLPTNLSAFTNDVGFITGITKSMVEGVLTGNITSHTHSYLPLAGGTIDGTLNIYNTVHRSTIKNVSQTNQPCDLWFGANGTEHWSLTSRASAENYLLALYASYSDGGVDTYVFTANLQTGVVDFKYQPTVNGNAIIHSGNIGSQSVNYANSAGDADTLDDLHAADFAKVKRYIVSGVDVNSIGYGITDNGNMYYGPMATFGTADYFIEIQSPYNKPELYYRLYNNNGYSDKKQFAFTDSNVASATKLQTARTIFGQPFDGTAKVSGTVSDIRRVIIGTDLGDWDSNRAELELITTSNNANDFWLGTNSQRDWCLSGRASADGNALHLYNRTLYRVATINQNGNILIGTTTDNGYKLDVNGKGHYSGDLIVDGEVSALVA